MEFIISKSKLLLKTTSFNLLMTNLVRTILVCYVHIALNGIALHVEFFS